MPVHPLLASRRVNISSVNVNQALEMVDQLRKSGLTMDEDFSWSYQKSNWDSANNIVPDSVTFYFQDPALATFYQLKWSRP